MPQSNKRVIRILKNLLHDLAPIPTDCCDIVVTGLASHSQKIHRGDLYFALHGERAHGLDFMHEVIQRKAAAVVWECCDAKEAPRNSTIPMIPVDDLHHKVGLIADRFFEHPSHDLQVIAVTGTNGKTSTTHFIAEALHDLHSSCGLIGTLGCGQFGALEKTHNTTLEALEMQRQFYTLREQSVKHVVLEASSHGLAQGRLLGTAVDIAVLTQIGRDHYDYHQSEQAYIKAKKILFEMPRLQYAVVNIDCALGTELASDTTAHYTSITYSAEGREADISADKIQSSVNGLEFRLKHHKQTYAVRSPILGTFNVGNLLATFAVLTCQGLTPQQAVEKIRQATAVPGRMQRIACNQSKQATVLLDYAHSADALEAALMAVKAMGQGRCYCVFGCGGNRDRGKRQAMGSVAQKYADYIVLTDDNPRHESASDIVADIIDGFSPDYSNYQVIHDRESAIRMAIQSASSDDFVLIAGKGHETEQVIGDQSYSFNDAEVIHKVLEEKG